MLQVADQVWHTENDAGFKLKRWSNYALTTLRIMNSSLLLCCFHYVHVFCDYLESKRLHSSWIIDVCGVPQSVRCRGKSSPCSCPPFLLQLLPFFDCRCSFLFNFRTFLLVFVRSLLPLQPSYSLFISFPCLVRLLTACVHAPLPSKSALKVGSRLSAHPYPVQAAAPP